MRSTHHVRALVLAALSGCTHADGTTPVTPASPDDTACHDPDGDGWCAAVDACPGPGVQEDVDGDGVCQEYDQCFGFGILPDLDGDGVCQGADVCRGDDASGDADADGVCNDLDVCVGNDARGDDDGDLWCDDVDPCLGDNARGDSDGDRVCDDLDACAGDDATGDDDGDHWCDDVDPCQDAQVAPGTDCTPPTTIPVNPCHGEPILYEGRNTGFVVCPSGAKDRLFATSGWQKPDVDEPPADARIDDCLVDADCTAGPYGDCNWRFDSYYDSWSDTRHNYCEYRCASDADCPDLDVCSAQHGWGTCVSATCRTGADCASGRCGYEVANGGCVDPSVASLHCRDPKLDECERERDCFGMTHGSLSAPDCRWSDDHGAFACEASTVTCGRPLLDDCGSPVVARLHTGAGDWQGRVVVGVPASAKARRAVARHWARIGALEHASVASFARHALQLLALGAPAELLGGVAAATADEVRHAQAALGVAASLGERVVPGPMPVGDAGLATDLDAVLAALVREGCVGETIAAAEAAWLADRAVDAGIGRVLATIAEDEARHAALAWQTVAWLVGDDRARVDRVEAVLADALDGPAAAGDEEGLVGWGVIDASGRADVREQVRADVVGPALAQLRRLARAA